MLGTTKPPYTLALAAALLRERGCEVRLVDLTAEQRSIESLIARLDAERFTPTLIVFPSTTPTLDADVAEMAKLKARFGAPLFCFGPHASAHAAESMARAPAVDGMFVGEPEDASLALASLDSLDGRRRPEPDLPARRRRRARTARMAASPASSTCPTRRGICSTSAGTACRWSTALRHRRDEPRLPVFV